MTDSPGTSLPLVPIGYVRGALTTKVEAARQPVAARGAQARIELLPGCNFEHALEDLASWELIWVLFWFHQATGWRPKVLPPRSTTGRKGIFATRAPHRPNPIGLSAVRLLGIEGLGIHIAGADMIEGTPVLDLKPYVAYSDAHPSAGAGWLDRQQPDAFPPPDPQQPYAVSFDPLAEEQAAWVERATQLELRQRIEATLMLGPAPHPYRRIKPIGDWMQLAVKAWRVRFTLEGRCVRVLDIDSGYRDSQLASETGEPHATHRAYLARWPRRS